jgi:hypothetical protein
VIKRYSLGGLIKKMKNEIIIGYSGLQYALMALSKSAFAMNSAISIYEIPSPLILKSIKAMNAPKHRV